MRLNPITLPWKSCLFHGILWVAPSKDPAASSLATVRCRVTPQRAVPGKSQNGRKEEKAPAQRAAAQRRGNMEKSAETREQTLKKIEYNLPKLTDAQLRLVSAFIRGIIKGQ